MKICMSGTARTAVDNMAAAIGHDDKDNDISHVTSLRAVVACKRCTCSETLTRKLFSMLDTLNKHARHATIRPHIGPSSPEV